MYRKFISNLSLILAFFSVASASEGLSVRERLAAWNSRNTEQQESSVDRPVDRSSTRKIGAVVPKCEAAVKEHCKSATCAQYCTAINAKLPADIKATRIADCLTKCPSSCDKGFSHGDTNTQFDILERLNNDRLMQCIAVERGAGGVRLGGDGTSETAHLPADWKLVITPSYRAVLIRAGMYIPEIEAVDNAGAADSKEAVGVGKDYATYEEVIRDREAAKAEVIKNDFAASRSADNQFRMTQAGLDAARARLRGSTSRGN